MRTEASMSSSMQARRPWRVDIETDELVVTVANGVAALTGHVRCVLRQALTGEEDGPSVETIDHRLEVLAPLMFKRADVEIAWDAAAAVRRALPGSCQCARFAIQDGRVAIDGELQWSYQRQRIEEAIRTVAGITDVSDRTTLNPQVDLNHVRGRIRQALRVSAEPGSDRVVAVRADCGVPQHGTLHSWVLRDRVEPC
jgi:osmotically-inducible protein OsmY